MWNVILILICSFTKVKHLRTNYKVLDIEVDGGVGESTIEVAAQVSTFNYAVARHCTSLTCTCSF